MRTLIRSLVALLITLVGLFSRTAAQELPPGFLLFPVGDNWQTPVSITFLDHRRALVAEKRGTVWFLEDDRKRGLALDLTTETLDNGDRGLLAIAAAPSFQVSGHLFALLVVNPDEDEDDTAQEAFIRLVRYTLVATGDGTLVADPSSRHVLLGDSWSTGIPSCFWSHACGSLVFLSDGSLVVAAG